jgi:hypothetical protein
MRQPGHKWILGAVIGITASSAIAAWSQQEKEEKAGKTRVFELRIYTPAPGKMEAMQARFRNYTLKLFEKHHIQSLGYWITTDPQLVEGKAGEPKLIYLVAHKSREGAAENWKALIADPAWAAARAATEKDGKLTAKVETIYLAPTDFSSIK